MWFFAMTKIETLQNLFKTCFIVFRQLEKRLEIEESKSLAKSHKSRYYTEKIVEEKLK